MLEALTAARANEVAVRQPMSTKDVVEGGRDARSGEHDATSEVIGVRVAIARTVKVERTSQGLRASQSWRFWTDPDRPGTSVQLIALLPMARQHHL
jgi:hypothetical protein